MEQESLARGAKRSAAAEQDQKPKEKGPFEAIEDDSKLDLEDLRLLSELRTLSAFIRIHCSPCCSFYLSIQSRRRSS